LASWWGNRAARHSVMDVRKETGTDVRIGATLPNILRSK
jgi:hypothetical protein